MDNAPNETGSTSRDAAKGQTAGILAAPGADAALRVADRGRAVQWPARNRSPLAGWPGGKSRLARKIAAAIARHRCYCEPFAGAAWVLFCKEASALECLNDINNDIYNFFETARSKPDALCDRAELTFNSRAMRADFLSRLDEPLADPVERAFRFYFLLRSSYRGLWAYRGKEKRASFRSGPVSRGNFSASRFMADVRMAARRLDKVILENLPWERLLDVYDRPETFFYMDPPYPGTRIDYGRPWDWDEYVRLASRLAACSGKFICSLNGKPEIMEIFGGFHKRKVETRYSISPGDGRVAEYLFSNYELPPL